MTVKPSTRGSDRSTMSSAGTAALRQLLHRIVAVAHDDGLEMQALGSHLPERSCARQVGNRNENVGSRGGHLLSGCGYTVSQIRGRATEEFLFRKALHAATQVDAPQRNMHREKSRFRADFCLRNDSTSSSKPGCLKERRLNHGGRGGHGEHRCTNAQTHKRTNAQTHEGEDSGRDPRCRSQCLCGRPRSPIPIPDP